jgi:integrase
MATDIIPRQEGIYWRVRIRRPAKGVNINERFKSGDEARRYIDTTVLPLLSKGEIPLSSNSRRVTFDKLTELYLAAPMRDMTGRRELKPSSVSERKGRIAVLKRLFGSYKLNALTPALIEREIKRQGWGHQNRQKYEVVLNQLFEWGRTEEGGKIVAANPMKSVKRAQGSSKKLRRVYTPEEWKTLLDKADEETVPLGLFLRLLRATGFRKSELRGLLWEDVKESDREGLGASLHIPDSKSGSPRTVFIKPDLYKLLQAHEQQYRRDDEPRVFRLEVDDAFRRVRKAAKLDQPDKNGEFLTVHAIRRTFATELGKRGATLAQMRAAGGWKTAEQAMRYMQVDEDLAAEAALLAGD